MKFTITRTNKQNKLMVSSKTVPTSSPTHPATADSWV